MSYDFRLFWRQPGEDPRITAERGSEDDSSKPVDPIKEALKRKIADALIAHNPKLEVFQFDYEKIAKSENISVEEARRRFRHLELNGPEEDHSGIQITLHDDEAWISVAYWHEGDRAGAVFREIWAYLQIICREGNYLVYDSQIDRVIDLSADFDDALACYTGGMRQVRRILPTGGARTKPWWKFW